ncbi:WD repeat, SAM and U-box domain-containing protein [Reticulomyxa filosa]|uniref:WD repeat, SAM and U-box domain-containing protein n=1 Tax=Reticulomyxa filosa TaxID=46433 RepID=X6MHU5_RETFI|nr:WD repeat, SAM and U-box domain-containing protein [Reticulomyxa filosa]|eukprot:ETO13424.1 WD repeat, SAM and U-box domain-containing protein [Reticulomyxa filosa]
MFVLLQKASTSIEHLKTRVIKQPLVYNLELQQEYNKKKELLEESWRLWTLEDVVAWICTLDKSGRFYKYKEGLFKLKNLQEKEDVIKAHFHRSVHQRKQKTTNSKSEERQGKLSPLQLQSHSLSQSQSPSSSSVQLPPQSQSQPQVQPQLQLQLPRHLTISKSSVTEEHLQSELHLQLPSQATPVEIKRIKSFPTTDKPHHEHAASSSNGKYFRRNTRNVVNNPASPVPKIVISEEKTLEEIEKKENNGNGSVRDDTENKRTHEKNQVWELSSDELDVELDMISPALHPMKMDVDISGPPLSLNADDVNKSPDGDGLAAIDNVSVGSQSDLQNTQEILDDILQTIDTDAALDCDSLSVDLSASQSNHKTITPAIVTATATATAITTIIVSPSIHATPSLQASSDNNSLTSMHSPRPFFAQQIRSPLLQPTDKPTEKSKNDLPIIVLDNNTKVSPKSDLKIKVKLEEQKYESQQQQQQEREFKQQRQEEEQENGREGSVGIGEYGEWESDWSDSAPDEPLLDSINNTVLKMCGIRDSKDRRVIMFHIDRVRNKNNPKRQSMVINLFLCLFFFCLFACRVVLSYLKRSQSQNLSKGARGKVQGEEGHDGGDNNDDELDGNDEDNDEDNDGDDDYENDSRQKGQKSLQYSITTKLFNKDKTETNSNNKVDTPLKLETPEEFLCPITRDIMKEPVICSDGFCYERTAIESWLIKNNTSPMTNQPLVTVQLFPNHGLRSMIQEFVISNSPHFNPKR